jgi:hypothetical protein
VPVVIVVSSGRIGAPARSPAGTTVRLSDLR